MPSSSPTQIEDPVTSGRLVAADGRTLPLRATSLAVTAGGGLARTRLRQTFANPYAEPLTVTYQLPLPADGAVTSFAFRIGDRRIEGEVEGRDAARARFEQALADGRSAALLEQDRTALFCQTIGNIPPGAEIVAEIDVDQLLQWLDGGEWEYRFPTTVTPRYLGEGGRVPDADRQQVDVAADAVPPRLRLALAIADRALALPTSPAHALHCVAEGDGTTVRFAAEDGENLDRDVVVRWCAAAPKVGAGLATARPGADKPHAVEAYGLLTLVPPIAPASTLARDLLVLLDTSGSMTGEPLAQAKAVIAALIDSLTERDQLSMMEFSNSARPWRPSPATATADVRREAHRWLTGLQAGGGTEMRDAVIAALHDAREGSQRQILLVTDGAVGFEREIVRALLQRLPRGCRFHTLGVGSAPNRTLTSGAARAGRGTEAIVGLGENPTIAARRCVAAMRAPIVVDLQFAGSALLGCAPAAMPDLFAGAPARIALRLRAEGGTLHVSGRTPSSTWSQELSVPATPGGAGRGEIVARFGREQVEDLELRLAAGEEASGIERQIETTGVQFQLATRLTSWVAVSSEPTVDPQQPMRREKLPHELPFGTSVDGLGLRRAGPRFHTLMAHSVACVERAEGLRVFNALDEWRRASVPPSLPPDRSAPAPRPRVPRAAIFVRRDGDLLWFEVAVDGSWTLPRELRVQWDPAIEFTAELDVALTTRPGPIPDGAVVRLCVRVPPHAPKTTPARLVLDGESLAVHARP